MFNLVHYRKKKMSHLYYLAIPRDYLAKLIGSPNTIWMEGLEKPLIGGKKGVKMKPSRNNDAIVKFSVECNERVASYIGGDISNAAFNFMRASTIPKYSYNFSWLSRPIIQYPQDMVAMQELIWQLSLT